MRGRETSAFSDGRHSPWASATIVLLCFYVGWQMWVVAKSGQVGFDYDEGVFSESAFAAASGVPLYRGVFLGQPPLLVAVLKQLVRVWGPSLTAERAAIVAVSVLWPAALYAGAAAIKRPRAGAFAVFFLLGSSQFLAQAHWIDVEVPSESLAAAAFALAIAGTQRSGLWWWLAAGMAAVFSVMTKLSGAACFVPLAAAALWRASAGGWKRVGALALGGLLAIAPFLPQIITKAGFDQIVGYHLELEHRWITVVWERAGLIAQFFAGEQPLAIAAVMGAGFGFAARERMRGFLLVWLAADAAILLTLNPVFRDHLIMLLSPLALLAGLGLDRMVDRVADVRRRLEPRAQGQSWGVRVGVAALGVIILVTYLVPNAWVAVAGATTQDLGPAANRIACQVPPDAEVVSDDPFVVFLARRRVPPRLVDTSIARFRAGELTEADLTAALRDTRVQGVLFWRGTFQKEFPKFAAQAARAYPVRQRLGGNRFLLLKPSGPRSGRCAE